MENLINKTLCKPTTSQMYLGSSKASSVAKSEIKWKFSRVKRTDSHEQISIKHPQHKQIEYVHQQIKANCQEVPPRCHHGASLLNGNLYVYGGYQNQRGILEDFLVFRVNEETRQGIWDYVEDQKPENKSVQNFPGPRHSHSLVVYDSKIILFGGKISMMETTNLIHAYSLEEKKWSIIKPDNPEVGPKCIDSHSAVIHENSMIIFGGFEANSYSNRVYAFNFQTNLWSVLAEKQENEEYPEPRGDFSMVNNQNKVYIYAGHCSTKVFSDLWKFDLQTHKFERLRGGLGRSGHSAVISEHKMFVFGGIKGITHERDDLVYYDILQNQWNAIWPNSEESHHQDNSDEDGDNCRSKINSIPKNKLSDRYPPETSCIQESKAKKYRRPIRQEKQQKALQKSMLNNRRQGQTQNRKNILFCEFQSPKNPSTDRFYDECSHSPLMQSLNNSILLTSNFYGQKNEKPSKLSQKKKDSGIKNSVLYSRREAEEGEMRKGREGIKSENVSDDENKLYSNIISARDGHSAHLLPGSQADKIPSRMLIFGGNRHMISYNQVFILNIVKLQQQAHKNQE